MPCSRKDCTTSDVRVGWHPIVYLPGLGLPMAKGSLVATELPIVLCDACRALAVLCDFDPEGIASQVNEVLAGMKAHPVDPKRAVLDFTLARRSS